MLKHLTSSLCYFKQVATNGNQVVMISCYSPGRLCSSLILFSLSNNTFNYKGWMGRLGGDQNTGNSENCSFLGVPASLLVFAVHDWALKYISSSNKTCR